MTRPLALVTGASSGIGAAFADELTRRGWDVVAVARSRAPLDILAAGAPSSVEVLVADLGDAADLARVEARIEGDGPRPDLVINCAATGRHAPPAAQSADDLTATVLVNVLAPLRLASAALRAGVDGVITVSSTASDAVAPDLAAYAASKAFLDSWNASAAQAPGGTRLTVVRPGYTRSAFHDRLGEDVRGVPDAFWLPADEVARRALDAHDAGLAEVTIEAAGAKRWSPQRLAGAVARRAGSAVARVRPGARRA